MNKIVGLFFLAFLISCSSNSGDNQYLSVNTVELQSEKELINFWETDNRYFALYNGSGGYHFLDEMDKSWNLEALFQYPSFLQTEVSNNNVLYRCYQSSNKVLLKIVQSGGPSLDLEILNASSTPNYVKLVKVNNGVVVLCATFSTNNQIDVHLTNVSENGSIVLQKNISIPSGKFDVIDDVITNGNELAIIGWRNKDSFKLYSVLRLDLQFVELGYSEILDENLDYYMSGDMHTNGDVALGIMGSYNFSYDDQKWYLYVLDEDGNYPPPLASNTSYSLHRAILQYDENQIVGVLNFNGSYTNALVSYNSQGVYQKTLVKDLENVTANFLTLTNDKYYIGGLAYDVNWNQFSQLSVIDKP